LKNILRLYQGFPTWGIRFSITNKSYLQKEIQFTKEIQIKIFKLQEKFNLLNLLGEAVTEAATRIAKRKKILKFIF
jgi:hypothetical protein